MTKIHGLNIVILLIWAALTCGGLGNAAYKFEGIYWVPFAVNLIIFLLLFLKEIRAMRKETGMRGDKCFKGSRGRQGDIPNWIAQKAEEYQSSLEPPYDADDIMSAFETGYIKAIKEGK